MTGRSKVYFRRAVPSVLLASLIPLSGPICRPQTPPVDDGTNEACTSYTPLDLSTHDFATNVSLPAGCYDLLGTIYVSGSLTLQPGTTVRCQSGSGIVVTATGYLNAVGTASQPILITAATATRGSGASILLNQSNSSSNRLEYVTIEYGGATDSGAVILVAGAAAPAATIAHCTVRQSAGYGLYVSGDADLSGFAANTLTQNTQGPCSLPPNAVQYLDAASSYSGNDSDAINLAGGTVTQNQIWTDLGVDYWAGNIQVAANLTLLPGVTIAFTGGGTMNVQSTGSLQALGTSGREITLTGSTQTPGFWSGLSYDNTTATSNILTLVTIEYGGTAGGGNLTLSTPPVAVTVGDCTFAHSAGCGIYVANGATINNDVTTANTFTDNPGGDVCP